jgi:glutamyl-tRNA reductase
VKPEKEILVWGANHNTCPLEVRERLALPSGELGLALDSLSNVAEEAIILSTCHRLEVYALPRDPDGLLQELVRPLSRWSGLDPKDIVNHSYLRHGREATLHLFTVSSGLDSVIAGEVQVLGQVRGALENARTFGTAGPILTDLFEHAISTGRRVRTETSLGRKDASLSAAAVRHADEVLGGLKGIRALIIGAGKMGLLAAQSLHERGVAHIGIVSRTPRKAREAATRANGTALGFDDLEEALCRSDLVISCTASPHCVVPYGLVRRVAARRDSPMLVIDLAVPRDVEPRVRDVEGVVLFDVDDLKPSEGDLSASVEDDVIKARAIVDEKVREFETSLREGDVIPMVAAMYRQAERIRGKELARSATMLRGLSDAERDTLDALTRSIVKKLLHRPATALKQAARDGNGQSYGDLAGQLFGLGEKEVDSGVVEGPR